jgi:imidazole glycerol-phosphate synthase subunit HisF
MQQAGAGEIILNVIDRDGTYTGYDLALIKKMSAKLTIPVVACGGAGKLNDFTDAALAGASAVAAGSFFVFQRPHQAVLISYPDQNELRQHVFEKL